MIKTFNNAVKLLEKYIPTPDKKHPGELGLARMIYLMDLLGNPQLKYPTIHVGGTSGKGSTATFIASILATKYKVGLTTSPHLVRINERIEIFSRGPLAISARGPLVKDKDIPEADFVDLVNYVKPFVEKVGRSKFGVPSYWEIVTAMTFLYFYQEKVDIAVIEVGVGGRFDASNVIKPAVAVLTNVGLDHTEILGDTVEKIAYDKVGIIKPGIQVVSGVRKSSMIRIIELKCERERAKLSLLNRDFKYQIKSIGEEGSIFDYEGAGFLRNLKLRLLGEHQVENAALAIRAVELLVRDRLSLRGAKRRSNLYRLPRSFHSLAMTGKNIRVGLKSAFIPGRLEIIHKYPLVILDGAHNSDKVRALVDSIKKIFPSKKVTSIIAIKNDKNAKEMLSHLLEISEKMIFTKFQLTADIGIISSYDPKELLTIAQNIRQHRYTSRHTKVVKELSVAGNVEKAVKESIKSAKPDDLILITGSLYLVGEVKKNYEFQNSNDK